VVEAEGEFSNDPDIDSLWKGFKIKTTDQIIPYLQERRFPHGNRLRTIVPPAHIENEFTLNLWNDDDAEDFSSSKYRIYRQALYNKITLNPINYNNEINNNNIFNNIIEDFCNDFNDIYIRFMNNIVNRLALQTGLQINIIENILIGTAHRNYDQNNKWDYLYNNWIERLNKYGIDNGIHFLTNIDNIENIILRVLDEYSDDANEQYITDSVGFFSRQYLVNYLRDNNVRNPSLHYNSCITYTYLEQYLLARIYYDPTKYVLILQQQIRDDNNQLIPDLKSI
jgi:hypothetical protein